MKEIIHPFDLHRIFLGDAPLLFLLEIVFRTIVMYEYTIFLLRVLGKRGMGQLSTLELAIIIGFGSAVGDPMMSADVPITHGIIAITVISILQIGLEKVINNHKKIEEVMEGEPNLVVDGGYMKLDNMAKDNLSKEDLFRMLRIKDISHLGEIEKAFFETTGQISVMLYKKEKVKYGLAVIPKSEIKDIEIFIADIKTKKEGQYACMKCGHVENFPNNVLVKNCNVCGGKEWIQAKN
jgi:uncharacterized membrane protein YcaP (DUF421 family)